MFSFSSKKFIILFVFLKFIMLLEIFFINPNCLALIPEFPISTILSEIKDSTSFFIPINAINVNFECSFKAILLRLKSSF